MTHPPDPRPVLLVETVARIDDAAIERLKKALARGRCPNGILFDNAECVILRDTYSSLDADSLVEQARVATNRVLARMPNHRTLEERVSDWLRSMAASWSDALPPEREISGPFIMDVVPAVSGSSIRQVA